MNYRQSFFKALFLFCQERDIDFEQVANLSGFRLTDLDSESDFCLSREQEQSLWKNLVQISGNELIGLHFGAAMQISALSLVGQFILSSQTVESALENGSALLHLFTDLYTMSIAYQQETFSVVFHKTPNRKGIDQGTNQVGNFLTTFMLHELKGLLMKPLKPKLVTLPTYQTAHREDYHSLFGCPVKSGPKFTVQLDRDDLQVKIISENHRLQTILIDRVPEIKNSVSGVGTFSKAVFHHLIGNSYLQPLNIEVVASNFNMSSRTLQRKLKAEGLTFLTLSEQVKEHLAMEYLRSEHLSIKEISYALGYAEVTGFTRAFKKWTRKTPGVFRKEIEKTF